MSQRIKNMIKTLLFVFLTFFLTACTTSASNKVPAITMPEMPLMPKEVNTEFKTLCKPDCNQISILVAQLDTRLRLQEDKKLITEMQQQLKILCSPKTDKVKSWLDELYIFKVKYDIYRRELMPKS